MNRHTPILWFAASFYLWGSLSPGNNMERFFSGRFWELLPNYNPLAFAIAIGIVAVGMGVAYLPDLLVRFRRGRARTLADRLTEAMNAMTDRMPAHAPALVPRRPATSENSRPGDRTIVSPSSPRPTRPFPPSLPASASEDTTTRLIRLDEPAETFRNDVRNAFGFSAPSIGDLIRPIEMKESVIGLTEPALRTLSKDRVLVNYLGVSFIARTAVAKQHLPEFEEVVRHLRICFALHQAFDLTAYLAEHPNQTPADALRAFHASTDAESLESNEDGPSAPRPVARLSHAGFVWVSSPGVCLTWREIAAFTATARGARKASPDFPSSVEIPATAAGPVADLEAALVMLTRGR